MVQLRVGPLVRATNATSAVIWTEWSHPCGVIVKAMPENPAGEGKESSEVTISTRTVTVGGHYYAAPELIGLQAGTWYTYRLYASSEGKEDVQGAPLQCFRTLDAPSSSPETSPPLRLAYGSCRNLDSPEKDALSVFGTWLMQHIDERETKWPRLLLLVGDQIYGDEPNERLVELHPQLHNGATTFEDFALMYQYAWTVDENVRQVLAALPTYMIFDDHEVTNNWNISPTWRVKAWKHGREQVVIDGLVAYWIYQGWGNLHQHTTSDHPLLHVMQEAAGTGHPQGMSLQDSQEDLLEVLRACIRQEVYGETHLHWHYDIPTTPPIFVADARADRPVVFPDKETISTATHEPGRIMSAEQMAELREWMHSHNTALTILVSSVPVLLPPLIGLAEYLMGKRLWRHSIAPLRWLGNRLSRIQEKFARRTSFDHWPVFSATWHELVELLAEDEQDILVLSGDVHFSYAMEATCRRHRRPGVKKHLYQLVSTPLQNVLNRKDGRMVLGQAWCKHIWYGGLNIRMLPLYVDNGRRRVPNDLLMRDTIALVTVNPQSNGGGYEIRQEYLGLVDGEVGVMAWTNIEGKR